MMQVTRLRVLYGVLGEGAESVARDPTGYLAIEQGIYRRHGLELSWDHIQGTDERNQALAGGEADLSLVIGRASLQHFLRSGVTRVIGSCMNSSPYLLMAPPEVGELSDLRRKALACRRVIAETAPLAATILDRGPLELGTDLRLEPVDTDQHALDRLTAGTAGAALLPRPFDFVARERGFLPVPDWPEVAADPLPITIETTESALQEKGGAMAAFLAAHREGIRYLKGHRSETLAMLERVFGYVPDLAAVLYDDYLALLDERLTIDLPQVERLLRMTAPDAGVTVSELASRWLAPGALTPQAPADASE
jgi:ABC-type nitrate/sulfonate/bicarbonate transport system substrate-binding protein